MENRKQNFIDRMVLTLIAGQHWSGAAHATAMEETKSGKKNNQKGMLAKAFAAILIILSLGISSAIDKQREG